MKPQVTKARKSISQITLFKIVINSLVHPLVILKKSTSSQILASNKFYILIKYLTSDKCYENLIFTNSVNLD